MTKESSIVELTDRDLDIAAGEHKCARILPKAPAMTSVR
jgi:hypothetical protein